MWWGEGEIYVVIVEVFNRVVTSKVSFAEIGNAAEGKEKEPEKFDRSWLQRTGLKWNFPPLYYYYKSCYMHTYHFCADIRQPPACKYLHSFGKQRWAVAKNGFLEQLNSSMHYEDIEAMGRGKVRLRKRSSILLSIFRPNRATDGSKLLLKFLVGLLKDSGSGGKYLKENSRGNIRRQDPPAPSPPNLLPPWLVSSGTTSTFRPPSPSVTLSLSPSTVPPAPTIPWLQTDRVPDNTSYSLSSYPSLGIAPLVGENPIVSELVECCRELEDERRTWAAHKKEAAWRLKRIELQLESEKACRRKEKMEEIEAKVKALREEQKTTLDRIEAEYREQLVGLRREAEAKEQKLAEQWAAKHMRLTKFLEQTGYRSISSEPNGR
ncbi:unnamed protein product [Fraxinus pennsylvanica]|uniref:Transcription factor AS1 n=1 Tax=Fraxinus pennsylvanica TaxID=56036 RepID=A0AAD1Z378_9LAMI|nr:unnamed protein product [Fraxinus pennsylvanica]